jgi:apolipoprotein N-acyltransferase
MSRFMKARIKSRDSKWEGALDFALTVAAGLVVFALHAPDRWLAAIYCTVVAFSATIWYFRNRWHSDNFWITMSMAFLIHILVTWFIFAIVLRGVFDIGLLICVPFIFIECFLLYHLVRSVGEQSLLRTDSRSS